MNKAIKYLFFLMLICCSSAVMAQPGDPGGDPDDPIPITGIEILIAAGGLFGAKKIYDHSKKEK